MTLRECYRTMVPGRFVCLDRWPNLWRKWCPGCACVARGIAQLANARTSNILGEKTAVARACVNTPGRAQHTLEVR